MLQQDVYSSVTNPPYFEDKERQRGDNEVFDTKVTSTAGAWTKDKDCSPAALQAMGDRLLDWFSVIMADAKRRRTHNKGKGIPCPHKRLLEVLLDGCDERSPSFVVAGGRRS